MEKINLKLVVKSKFFWGSIIVLLLITTTTFCILKEKEKTLRISVQEELAGTIVKKKAVENKLAETVKSKEKVQEELTAEKERTFALEKKVEEKERQIKLVLEKLEKEIAARQEAEANVVMAMKTKRILEAKVKRLAKRPKVFVLEKIIVKPAPVLTGKVLEVNNEHTFVVVDLGKLDKLNLGDILSIYRNDRFVGRVQVEKVREDICAAAVLPEWYGVEFKREDEARVL